MRLKTGLTWGLTMLLFNCFIINNCVAQEKMTAEQRKQIEQSITEETFSKTWGLLSFFSERILKDSAEKLINLYLDNPKVTANAMSRNVRLESFSITADQMRNLLAPNENGEEPDKIVLALGLERAPLRWHLIMFGIYDNTVNTNLYDGAINDDIIRSSPLPDHDAGVRQREYNYGNRGRDRWVTVVGNNPRYELGGLSFDAWQMREIVDDNAYGRKPDKVIFKFGRAKVSLHGRNYDQWHIVAYGQMNDGTLLDISHTISGEKFTRSASIFDKADPYPR
jgi:hypothetical protein